ncbi:MAG: putative glycosyltransferase EpsD [Phycisphaerae bacterium]|nr:putative glycosyltransferase EpsD [Phycisphaerae bacterium]
MEQHPSQLAGAPPLLAHVVTSRYSVRTIMRSKLDGLAKRGFRQLVIAADDGQPVTVPDGATLFDVPIPRNVSPLRDLLALRQIRAIFRRHRPDIVHTRTAKAGLLGRLAARLAGVRIVLHTTHGLPFYDGQARLPFELYKRLERLAARLSDYVFSQNLRDYHRLIQHRVVPPHRTAIEGNGVDLSMVCSVGDATAVERVRAEFGAAAHDVLVVMLARLEPIKRVDRFIDALARVRSPRLKAVVCGEGPELPRVRARAAELNLGGRLLLAGQRNDPWNVLAAADFTCLTSDKEGLPRSVIEGMALGRPAVATDVPGTDEVVVNERTGLLAPAGDADALAAALDRMCQDDALRRTLGEASRRRAAQHFDENAVLDRLEYLYRTLHARQTPDPERITSHHGDEVVLRGLEGTSSAAPDASLRGDAS